MKHKRRWTVEEDQILREGFEAQAASPTGKGHTVNWKEIANRLPGRSNKDCRKRYLNEMAGTLKKGPWSKEEDALLVKLVERHNPSWVTVSQAMGTRNADQCAKRWQHSLNPELDRQPWQDAENDLLLRALAAHGTSWKDIQTKHFPARSTNNIKNQYTVLMRRDAKMAPDIDATPCCPSTGSPETICKSPESPSSISESMDLCDPMQEPELPHEDEFLTNLSADTPETDMNDILGSVFGDSASSLELLTPIEGENPEHGLLHSAYKIDSDPTSIHTGLHPIQTHYANDQDIFSNQPLWDFGDDMNSDALYDFSASVIPPFDSMVPATGHVPDLEMAKGYSSESSPGGWGADFDLQTPRSEEAARMTIVIDEARPETLTEVMMVLMESRARVEFRRG